MIFCSRTTADGDGREFICRRPNGHSGDCFPSFLPGDDVIGIKTDPPEALRSAADLYESRNAIYGDTWKRAGPVFHAMFPDGLTLTTADDFARFVTLVQIVSKVQRYAHRLTDGGHLDSAKDLQVYGAILEAKTDE